MSFHAVVTVDLDNGVSSTARSKFNEELKKKGFKKHKLTTLWTATYAETCTRDFATKYARESVDNAAKTAGISAYEAFVSISEAPPVEWSKTVVDSLVETLMRFQK